MKVNVNGPLTMESQFVDLDKAIYVGVVEAAVGYRLLAALPSVENGSIGTKYTSVQTWPTVAEAESALFNQPHCWAAIL